MAAVALANKNDTSDVGTARARRLLSGAASAPARRPQPDGENQELENLPKVAKVVAMLMANRSELCLPNL